MKHYSCPLKDPVYRARFAEAVKRADEKFNNPTPGEREKRRLEDIAVQRAMGEIAVNLRRCLVIDRTQPYAWQRYNG